MSLRALRVALILVFLISSIGALVGCAGLEVLPDGRWVPMELVAAGKAIDAARKAGKDKECPDEFKAAEKLQKDAWPVYQSCHTKEAIAMSNEAIAKAKALCPAKPAPAPAPVPPAPTIIAFSASPASIDQGKCTTLSWSSVNAKSASIDQGVGSVDAGDGSKQVCPNSTTQYTLTATGGGGSKTSSTTVNVVSAAPIPIDKLTVHVNFDTNKSTIRKSDIPELQKALAFVKKYPGSSILVNGYTDSTGSDKYNMGLSDRRAAAVRQYLVDNGVTSADKITSKGFGKADPIASNDTADGRFQNRRVEIVILSK
jgi:OmpA-OmpF porin, OOP family